MPHRFLASLVLGGLLFLGTARSQAPARAVDFTLPDLNGQNVSNTDYQGKAVLLYFWATWCQPCMVEMKHLDRFEKAYKDKGFSVIAVSIDDARSASMVKPLMTRSRYSFQNVLDTQQTLVGQVNPPKTLPYSMLIDQSGAVVWTHHGYNPGDEDEMERQIQALLTK